MVTSKETHKNSSFISVFSTFFFIFLFIASPSMTLKGSGASQACAVCKYQRRRCTKDCLLAPYFPADQPKVFLHAHRLFGVSNIQKILKEVHPDQREEAVKSIKYESYIRARFPVHGCCEVIWQLRYQIQMITEELHCVLAHLALLKSGRHYETGESSNKSYDITNSNFFFDNDTISCLPNGFSLNGRKFNDVFTYSENNTAFDAKSLYTNKWSHMQQIPCYDNFYDHSFNHYDSNNHDHHNISNSNNLSSQEFLAHREINVPQDYDELPPFDTIGDERQSYTESKEACESSAESMLKNEYVVENELKSAAACFSLTSTKDMEDSKTFL